MEEPLLPFIDRLELFSKLTSEELRFVSSFIKQKSYSAGDYIAQEGEISDLLYYIVKGKVEIIKSVRRNNDFHILAVLGENDWVGEMAYLENRPRSASIRVAENTEVLTLSLNEVKTADNGLYLKLLDQLTLKISQRFRKANNDLIANLKEKLKIVKSQKQISETIIYLIIFISLFFNVSRLINTHWPRLPNTYSPAVLFPIFLCTIIVIAISDYPLKYYGLSWKNGWKETKEAIFISVPFLALCLLIEWILISTVPSLKGLGLFASYTSDQYRSLTLAILIYLPLIPIQEIIARGFLQNAFKNFFIGPHRVILAILTSNLIFELFHTVKGLWFAFFAFVVGIFWGYLFNYQKTIIGVSVSHAIVALGSFFLLNYLKILDILP